MVNGIRIYVEGGGDSGGTKGHLRTGFITFLRDIYALARQKRCTIDLIPCGSRNSTFKAFAHSLQDNPEAFNVLLVDSEGPTSGTVWQHLKTRDGWAIPELPDDHCHLMTQAMEAWFIADLGALSSFYGKGFNNNPIPKAANVEVIAKDALEPALKAASKDTQKGPYHKTRHAPRLLECVDPKAVRAASASCDRLFKVLEEKLA